MTAANGGDAVIRRAGPRDVDAILDLLMEYGLPRAYFEPFYLADRTYRPEHSWIAERDGRLVAHLRVYDRWIYLHGAAVRIGGVGNVITAYSFRGQGYAGRLLAAMAAAAPVDGFAYSLLWTHLPMLYERHGWAVIDQPAVRASMPALPLTSARIVAFQSDDLPDTMRLYEATNARRTGPTVRSLDYWRAQLTWLAEDRDGFLLARRNDGSLAAYVRSRRRHSDVEILELGLAPEDLDLGRTLVGGIAQRHGRKVQARLPPSLLDVLPPGEPDVEDDSRLMGRVVSHQLLVHTLRPVLQSRVEAAGLRRGTCWVATSTGAVQLRVRDGQLTLHIGLSADRSACLTEAELGHLLFHGYDGTAADILDGRCDTDLLRILFPAQDFVVWPADKF